MSRRSLSSLTAAITKPSRSLALRSYPTKLVHPDGSSVNVSYHEPRRIVQLPIDLTTLSDEQRRQRLERMKPKKKVVIAEEIENAFDANKYLSHFKKK